MEIIKKGKLPEDEVYYGKCYYCKTEMKSFRKELKFQSDFRDGDYYYHSCPLCGKTVYFGPNKDL